MAGQGTGQRKSPTLSGGTIEKLVEARLRVLLPLSRGDQLERGGIVHRHTLSKALGVVEFAPGSHEAIDLGFNKDALGQYVKPNRGCPPNTTPVAFYHTHGRDDSKLPPGMRRSGPADFSDEDKRVATEEQLVAYVALDDGRWKRFTPVALTAQTGTVEREVNGERVMVPFRALPAFNEKGQDYAQLGRTEFMNGNLLR